MNALAHRKTMVALIFGLPELLDRITKTSLGQGACGVSKSFLLTELNTTQGVVEQFIVPRELDPFA